ncbi:hypothetical protein [Paracoccus laeviglucosivorans]|uniref:Uncharacterized protein n=1 Tax=Paracoccus laeviglucosivorans TaxID=1197861 RepID=A0A521ER80_9RHOB|nr:hypothetical protein [Paracoccus laeviglucosivorans]SMO85610.1 hypothetical protein SAMN06265221_11473 [Paracoccus laeviglucosivorans]
MSTPKDNAQRISNQPQQEPATCPAGMEDERECPERGDDKPVPSEARLRGDTDGPD